ncbi:MAG: NAD-dependent epimerase/dehydratase family protein [Halorhabdus sp.]
MTVFVPGGNGFLGSRVTRKLDERDVPYVSLSRRDGYDFRDPSDVQRVFEEYDVDTVLNCAVDVGGIAYVADRPGEVYYNNTLIATHLMEFARRHGVERFVNPIANCTYPESLTGEFEEVEWWDGPMHESVLPFAITRKASWAQGKAYHDQYGFDSVHLIIPNMYGPGDHFDLERSHALGALLMKFVEADHSDDPTVTVWGTGEPVREWLYVDDGAEALIRALDIEPTTEPVNVGTGEGVSIMELAELIRDIVGYDGDIVLDESKPDGDPYRRLDPSRMQEIFEWEPDTELRAGIQKTVEWYRQHELE